MMALKYNKAIGPCELLFSYGIICICLYSRRQVLHILESLTEYCDVIEPSVKTKFAHTKFNKCNSLVL